MALVRIERSSRLPVGEAWRRLTDWGRHAQRVPFTGITVTTPPPTGVGTLFVARTGLGRVYFDDPMEVVHWQPPAADRAGHCRLEKQGSAVAGWAEIEARPQGAGSSVVWCEEIWLRKLPRAVDPLTFLGARLLFGRVVTGLLNG
ncbi:SRPBCC family protein [Kitasatospora sp. RB6PN24]|uniref:SRPBCC family protein n=1 Tax=Kitasatospora humi TaxID=2893891 RepID=UPI001E3D71A8|nr:SRPBCC family protein [Kitasatospora humi]MCC9307943.1 SRPBCC family protein [Kitasatospora humi]